MGSRTGIAVGTGSFTPAYFNISNDSGLSNASAAAASEYASNKRLQAQADEMAKKQFENAKRLQMAQIIMSTAAGIMKNVAQLGIAISAPLNIATAALGAVQLANVAGQSYTPREMGGSFVGGQGLLVGEAGPELIVPHRSGTVVNNKGLGNLSTGGSGEVNVTFEVTTNDASGFSEMLVQNRGTITNIIRQAQNESMGSEF